MENIDQTRAKLYKYLAGITTYKETYEEIFDHVLKVVESKEQPFSKDLIQQIIEEEFGGENGIKRLEKEAILATRTKVNEVYRQEFKSHFRGFNLIIIFCLTTIWFFISKSAATTHFSDSSVFIPLLIVEGFILLTACVFIFLITWLKRKSSLFKRFLFLTYIRQTTLLIAVVTLAVVTQQVSVIPTELFAFIFALCFLLTSIHIRIYRSLLQNNLNLKTT